jgi:hypothetical protein
MPDSFTRPGLPLLVVIEGENDIHFFNGLSRMLHRADTEMPDLSRLASDRRITFLPTGGSNLNDWVSRLASCISANSTCLIVSRNPRPPAAASSLNSSTLGLAAPPR